MNKLRLSSIRKMFVGLSGIIQRYPVITGIAFLKMVFAIWQLDLKSEYPNKDEELTNLLLRLSLILSLALPLFYALQLTVKRYLLSGKQQVMFALGICMALLLFFLSIHYKPLPIDWYRFGIYFLVSHAVVAFSAYLKTDNIHEFWQHNKNMAVQFLNASFYTGILFVGLVIAIYAVETLFQFQFGFPSQGYTFIILAFFFHTLFFLVGMEREVEKGDTYPKALKFFAQYALLPLVAIYLLILYAYAVKILINWELPQGGVAYLVLSLAVAGILVYLLIYPWKKDSQEKWITLYSRYFFPAVLPLNILLFAGIARRISDYDITENRYLVLTLAIWLAGISSYMIFNRKKDIRLIPVTMAIVGLLISVGPWNIFSVAEKSQKNRFEEILKRNNLLNESGKIMGKADVSREDYIQVFDIIEYFNSRKQLSPLLTYLNNVSDTTQAANLFHEIREELSLHITSDTTLFRKYLSYSVAPFEQPYEFISIEEFDYLWKIKINDSISRLNNGYEIVIVSDSLIIRKEEIEVAKWDLKKKIGELETTYGNASFGIPGADLLLESDGPACQLILTHLSYNPDKIGGTNFNLSGYLLLKNNFKSNHAKKPPQLLE